MKLEPPVFQEWEDPKPQTLVSARRILPKPTIRNARTPELSPCLHGIDDGGMLAALLPFELRLSVSITILRITLAGQGSGITFFRVEHVPML